MCVCMQVCIHECACVCACVVWGVFKFLCTPLQFSCLYSGMETLGRAVSLCRILWGLASLPCKAVLSFYTPKLSSRLRFLQHLPSLSSSPAKVLIVKSTWWQLWHSGTQLFILWDDAALRCSFPFPLFHHSLLQSHLICSWGFLVIQTLLSLQP